MSRRYLGSRRQQGTGADDAALAHFDLIQNRRSHADDAQIADRAAVQSHRVPDGHAIADGGRKAIVRDVKHGVVLDRCLAADADVKDIAADDGAEPDARSRTDVDIANDRRIRRDVDAGIKLRPDAAKRAKHVCPHITK